MAKINLKQILQEQNKSLYALASETNISYPTLHKLAKGETNSINFDTLEIICNNLNISLNDLVELDPSNKRKIVTIKFKKTNKKEANK